MVMLSSCNLPSLNNGEVPSDTAPPALVQSTPTPPHSIMIVPTFITPTMSATLSPTLIPPNIPVWSIYNYTCEPAIGGGNMTMNLNWTDRPTGEESYRVYRDEQLIATLIPNSTSYVDIVFLANGKTVNYSVQAFNKAWQASTSTITNGCQ